MKRLKKMTALMLTLCLVLTGAVPVYAEEVEVPEQTEDTFAAEEAELSDVEKDTESETTTPDTNICEDEEVPENIREASPANADYIELEEISIDQDIELFEEASLANAKYTDEVFTREAVVDGITITLTADVGVFPEEAELWVENVEDADTEEAIDQAIEEEKSEEETEKNVASRLRFDIKMLLDGEEIQPVISKGKVKISFSFEEIRNDSLDVNIYHVTGEDDDLVAEALDVRVEDDRSASEADEFIEEDGAYAQPEEVSERTVVTAEIEGFSYYVIEFTGNSLTYRLGKTSVKLSEIIAALNLGTIGDVNDVTCNNGDILYISGDGSDKVITPLRASTADDGDVVLSVYIGGAWKHIYVTVGETVRKTVTYIDENGAEQTADCVVMSSTDAMDDYSFETDEWYVAEGTFTVNNRIENNAPSDKPAHLILGYAAVLNASKGIHNPAGKGLVIYTHSTETPGILNASASDPNDAGIGGNKFEGAGYITINGGIVTASSSKGAGIGGGFKGSGGNIIINGGNVEATSQYGAGIGGGELSETGGNIIINEGNVEATSQYGAGIGGGHDAGMAGNITINGGTVTAKGTLGGAGIGSGQFLGKANGNVTITGGTIMATSGGGGTAIGCGYGSSKVNINISGGTITAKGTAGIGAATTDALGSFGFDESKLEILTGPNEENYQYQPVELYKRILYSYVKVNEIPSYTVKHCLQKPDGTGYEVKETETFKSHTGLKTEAVFKSYDGFTPLNVEQQIVKSDNSTVVEIQYNRLNYTLVFDSNGHGKAPAAITAAYGENITKPTDPTAEGYIFGGWYEEEACTTPYTFTTMPLGGKTIYAKWEKSPEKKYTITWMLNDITLIDTTEVTEGEMPVHNNPAIEGRIFIGWKPALVPVTGNVKYTAYFEERGTNKIAVTFNTDGGTFIDTQVIDRNTTPVKPSDPQKEGCRFEGWYRESGFITPYNFDEPFNTDMTLYAKWTVLPAVVYTVTWNMDDGTLIDITEEKEGNMPSHSNPSKEGYIFLGWEPSLAPVMGDITYTAKFEQRTLDKAAVTFNTDGGSFVETQVVTKGQKAQRPADPIKSGYSFVNWYADAALAALYDFNTVVSADITLFAKWQKNAGREYTITWKDWNGNILATSKVAENGLPKYPGSKPSRSGYIFTGWTPELDLVYADRTYTATYEPKSSGGGGGSGSSVPAVKKAAVTFSPNWYSDIYGVWRIKNSKGEIVKNAWLCDDTMAANGQNVWYLLGSDGAMLAAGLVQDATGNFYSLETNHDGYFGMLRYTDGYYNCNGQQVYLKFSHEHNGTFGAVINADGIEKLKAIYGVTQYGIGNENAVYTKTF